MLFREPPLGLASRGGAYGPWRERQVHRVENYCPREGHAHLKSLWHQNQKIFRLRQIPTTNFKYIKKHIMVHP